MSITKKMIARIKKDILDCAEMIDRCVQQGTL